LGGVLRRRGCFLWAMGDQLTFERLVVWQEARALTKRVYRLSENGPLARDWPLRNQMRKTAVSVAANIAEGWERSRPRELLHFLMIAKASCAELRSHLHIAHAIGNLDSKPYSEVIDASRTVGGLIGRLWLKTKRRAGPS
jgi:four helix bundle protein